MTRRDDTADIRALLQSRIESLVAELVPDGHRAGPYWMCRNPTRDDRHLGSMWVRISGSGIGAWADEATGDGGAQSPNGQHKGDVLGLIGYIKGLPFGDVMKWARDFTGIAKLDDEKIRIARATVARRENDAEREAKLLADNRGRAFAHWLKASEKLAGTPVETYLATRGIALDRLAAPPGALRFMPRKHIETGQILPAMLALMTGPPFVAPSGADQHPARAVRESVPYAVHCTFLKPDGSGKANVMPVRKMWPSYAGSTIRLARGETKLRPAEAAKLGLLDTLCLCEGVEDGLSIALACPELRVWAVGALGNLGRVVLPECCAEVIVAADNDWGKPQAQKLLDAGVAALMAQGRKVSIARSFIGKDANDALRAGALSAPEAQRKEQAA